MEIISANGHPIQIDPEDFDRVAPYRWGVYCFGDDLYYATTSIAGKTVYMHRFLMDAPKSVEVDHEDGNGLNNRRRTNLRLATHMQNLANQRLNKANTSGFRGVTRTRSGKWHAQIKHCGKHIGLGSHATPEAAYQVRLAKEREIFGEFARAV